MRNPLALRGTIGRGAYLAWGIGLFALKLPLDAWLVGLLLDRPWEPSFYLTPLRWPEVYPVDSAWHAVLFGATSLPFLWMGVGLTLRRLRDAGLPTALLALFVFPILNLLFFVLLAFMPSAPRPRAVPVLPPAPRLASPPGTGVVWQIVGANLLGGAVLAATFAVSVLWLGAYGSALFLAAPFLHGFCVARALRPLGFTSSGTVAAATVGVLCACLLLLTLGREGIGCLVMALPLLLPAVAAGAMIGGVATAEAPRRPSAGGRALLLLLGPLAAAVEHALRVPPDVHEVTSTVAIAATPEQIWPLVVAFPALPEPDEFLFRAGIAYPTSARIDGEGEGAVRHCTFNTGPFVEPITAWQPPYRLAFDVVDSPQPMIEWNPLFAHVDAPHLHGFFRAQRGEFRLEPLPDGRTRLCGTTWYAHGLRPEWYWALWSNLMVHRIHTRVLDHIAALAEGRR
jgi:uncharacterized membrane protein YhaH (DUF805 family)